MTRRLTYPALEALLASDPSLSEEWSEDNRLAFAMRGSREVAVASAPDLKAAS